MVYIRCHLYIYLFYIFQGGRGHWTVNYTGTRSLVTNFWMLLLKCDWLVQFKNQIVISLEPERQWAVYYASPQSL